MLSRLRFLRRAQPISAAAYQTVDHHYEDAADTLLLPGSPIPHALTMLRWTILIATLTLTLAWSIDTRSPYPLWIVVLGFMGYNLATELLRRWTRLFGSFSAIALLDLPIAMLTYYLDEAPGGPLFVIFFLGIITAGMSMTTMQARLYIGVTVGIFATVATALPSWSASETDLRQIGSRLIILVVVGIGTTIVRRQLLLERKHTMRWRELHRLRTEFVETMSHDLQTPLTAIRAGVGMLAQQMEDRLESHEQGLLNNVRRNVDRLGIQISNLLLLNQLDSGTLEPEMELLDLREAANAAVSTVRLLTREKRQTLTASLPIPLPVYGDATMLEQMIVNLLANAHRHTPPGTVIQIEGKIRRSEVELVVRDEGPGISVDDQAHLFQRYYRKGTAAGGSGLGLAIVDTFATLHRGRVRVVSQPGHGSAFIITIPLAGTDIEL